MDCDGDPETVVGRHRLLDLPRRAAAKLRRWAERRFAQIRYWGEPARGCHFAAFEQPELFVEEVRAAFRALRD